MFCTEDRPRLTSKMREIQIRPVPIANVSCHNEEVWDTRVLAWQNVLQSSVLAILALVTLIANLIFVLVLRSNKYHRSVHVQVPIFFHTGAKIHILSKNSHIENSNFYKIHSSEITFLQNSQF